jgi:hypothetical protein
MGSSDAKTMVSSKLEKPLLLVYSGHLALLSLIVHCLSVMLCTAYFMRVILALAPGMFELAGLTMICGVLSSAKTCQAYDTEGATAILLSLQTFSQVRRTERQRCALLTSLESFGSK